MIERRKILPKLYLLAFVCSLASCKDQVGPKNGTGDPTAGQDGQGRLVYTNLDGNHLTAGGEVIIMDSAGAGMHNIIPMLGDSIAWGVTWSSGHGRFVWCAGSAADVKYPSRVVISSNDGTQNTVVYLARHDSIAAFPLLSPDGSHLAMVLEGRNGGIRSLIGYTVTGGANGFTLSNPHLITDKMEDQVVSAFSPDGQQIAYYDSSRNLVMTNFDGSSARVLAANVEGETDQLFGTVSWSSLNRIAFCDSTDIRVINSDATGLVTIDSGAYPLWSPDGKTLAYSNAKGVFLTSDLGITKHALTANPLTAMPQWSPDGTKILCISALDPSGPTSVSIVDVATGNVRMVATPGFGAVWLR